MDVHQPPPSYEEVNDPNGITNQIEKKTKKNNLNPNIGSKSFIFKLPLRHTIRCLGEYEKSEKPLVDSSILSKICFSFCSGKVNFPSTNHPFSKLFFHFKSNTFYFSI